MSSIKVTGIDELQMKLKKNVQMSDVKKVVRKNGSDMQKKPRRMHRWIRELFKEVSRWK